jgi:NADH-quinone oxidoreductase subunit I
MESPATPLSRTDSPPPSPARWTMPGIGLLKGLVVTGMNMLQSYYRKDRMTTVQYPEQRAPISPNFRNFPFLCYDGDDPVAGLRCTACSICEKECPPQCIYIVLERDENGKSLKRPKVFDIDLSVCMNCGICAEVCPFDSIYMDGEYELSTDDRLSKSADYHMKLRPEQATEIATRRKADEEKKLAAAAAKEAKAKADKLKKEQEAKEPQEKGDSV